MTDLTNNKTEEGQISFEEITTEELMNLSIEPFGDIWGMPENDHWDEFFKTQHLKPPIQT